jgi:hypothetical protein
LHRLDRVRPAAVQWVWPRWLAAGQISLLVGSPGSGRSLLAQEAAAIVSRGGVWPDGSTAPRGRVLIINSRDSLDQTLVPRLEEAGADLGNIQVLSEAPDESGVTRPFSFHNDLDHLEQALVELDDLKLIVVDTLTAHLGAAGRNAGVIHGIAHRLRALAAHTGAAVLIVTDRTRDRGDLLGSAAGSVALTSTAVTVMALLERRRPAGAGARSPGRSRWEAPPPRSRLRDPRLAAERERVLGPEPEFGGPEQEDDDDRSPLKGELAAQRGEGVGTPQPDATACREGGRGERFHFRSRRRVLVAVKHSLSEPPAAISIAIGSRNGRPRLRFGSRPLRLVGETGAALVQARGRRRPRPPRKPHPVAECAWYLKSLLADCDRPAADIFQRLDLLGFSRHAMNHAARRLGVHKLKPDLHAGWIWRLPGPDGAFADKPLQTDSSPDAIKNGDDHAEYDEHSHDGGAGGDTQEREGEEE